MKVLIEHLYDYDTCYIKRVFIAPIDFDYKKEKYNFVMESYHRNKNDFHKNIIPKKPKVFNECFVKYIKKLGVKEVEYEEI